MKQASAAAYILLAISGVHAAKFALPKCAGSCLSVPQTCEATEAFCGSACFGPCLTSGCSGAYDQQQLIKACSNTFASGGPSASATVTATTTKKPQAAATASNGTETSTKTAKSQADPEKTPLVEKPKPEKSDDPLGASPSSADSSNSTNSTAGNSTSTDPAADTGSAATSFAGSLSAGVALFILGLALL